MKIFLHGELGKKFGEEWKLSVKSPNEAFRAIDANKDGFFKHLCERDKHGVSYRIFVDKKGVKNTKELAIESEKIEEMHVLPVIKGRDRRRRRRKNYQMAAWGFGGMAVGYGLSFLGGLIGGFWGGLLGFIGNIGMEIGGAMIMQGAMGLLAKEPPKPPAEDTAPQQKSTTSFTFARPLNTVVQGAPIPVGYGRLRVGSQVVSSSLMNSRMMAFNQSRSSTSEDGGNLHAAVNVDHYTL